MQSLPPETSKNQSNSDLPIPGITLSESWRSAFGKLSAGCLSDARAVILIGERGLGKSSLIEAWRDQSAAAFNVVTLKNAAGEPDQVVAELASLMGVDTADLGRSAILSAITSSVKTARESGKETVVIVDEASDLPGNTIELLMVLARDRGSNKPLLRYIISGSDKLRKTMRLDGGAARRQNYVTIELERFTPEQSKAFVIANLARSSDITISDEAAIYLHESTSGKPANILTVLDKVRQGRLDAGETEITLAHIQSLVKAPKPAGAAPQKPTTHPGPPLAEDIKPAQTPNGSVGDGKKTFAEPGNVFATNADLPDSIRNVNDPRPLLRWAFGLDEHSETEALTNRAEASAAAAREASKSDGKADADLDLNEALARVAKREKDARAPAPTPTPAALEQNEPAKDVLRATRPGPDNGLGKMIESEAFSFEERGAASVGLANSPGELNDALRQPPPVQSGGRTNKLVFAAGVAVMGVAALGLLWTALQPNEIVNPLDASPQQTASVAPVSDPEPAPDAQTPEAQTAAAIAPDTDQTEPSSSEPDLAGVIARLKSPEIGEQEADRGAIALPFRDNAPRIISSAYLAPTGTITSTENAGIRRSMVADMAASERVELVGEESRLMEQLASLEEQVNQKEGVLASLERAINAMSAQTMERSDVLDSRNDEIEVVTSRLAFIARDRALAASRLEAATNEAQSAEERLQLMRDELAAAETLIQQNQTLLDQNQTTTANLGEAVAKREAEFADLTRKVADAETELASRREELAAVIVRQQEAETALAELEGQLADTRASQVQVAADLEQLVADRAAQMAASEALNSEVSAADTRLAAANAELDAANTALAERTAALAEIEAKTQSAQDSLTSLVSELETRQNVVTTSNQEVTSLQTERDTLANQLSDVALEIEKANGQLEALEADQQTASSEFANLSANRDALLDELRSREAVLNTLNANLAEKERAVDALETELANGTALLEAQRNELAALQVQSADIVAAQTNAQTAVDAEQSLVASATNELEALRSEQTAMTAALAAIQSQTTAAQTEFAAIEARKAEAEAEIVAAMARLEEIKAQEVAATDGATDAVGDVKGKQTRLSELDQLILASNKELEAVVTKKAALNSQLAALTDEGTARLRAQQAELDRISEDLAEKQQVLASLTQDISTAEATASRTAQRGAVENLTETAALETVTVPAVRVRPASSDPLPSVTEQAASAEVAQPSAGIALTPRDLDLVKQALTDAPGLGRAPQEQKDQLQSALVRGECVTDALKATFGRVNPHTLVALLENMEMCGS